MKKKKTPSEPENDRQRITRAFRELRKLGYFARQKWSCCGGCGSSEVPSKYKNKYVFYHMQDNQSIDEFGNINGELYMCHGEDGNGNDIVYFLNKHGLDASWNGNINTRVLVKHKE